MSLLRRILVSTVFPVLLLGWEVGEPIPWSTSRERIVFALLALATVQVTIWVQQRRRLPPNASAAVVLILALGLAGAMLSLKVAALLFFNLLVAVGYALLVTSGVRARQFVFGVVGCACAAIAMNTKAWIQVASFLAACAFATLLVHDLRMEKKKLNSPEDSPPS